MNGEDVISILIFVQVKKFIRQIIFLILTVGIVIMLADYSLNDTSFSHSHVTSHKECTDLSDHSELPHNHGSEDNVLICDSKLKSTVSQSKADYWPYESIHPEINFISCIWQPPKFL